MSSLHMLSIELDLPRLYALASRLRFPKSDDLGYPIHCALKGLFGDDSPTTFARKRTRGCNLLAYSRKPLGELRDHAASFAEPEFYTLLDWESAASKPMPTTWEDGRSLGFQVRACASVRVGRSDPLLRRRSEVDAYVAARTRDPDGTPDRNTVYREWLASALRRHGGANLVRVSESRFMVRPLLRRSQGPPRRAKSPRLPDVTFFGTLTVSGPAAFQRLLARGVGRHRAFGFGMLLLRAD